MPFGRLLWDETVATLVTRVEPHNQGQVRGRPHIAADQREQYLQNENCSNKVDNYENIFPYIKTNSYLGLWSLLLPYRCQGLCCHCGFLSMRM